MTDGFLVVDKAGGMTSHDVVAVGRKALGTRKVGHAGTLDPMATGVLVLGFGNGTRLLQYITDGDKSYVATIVLGASTVTDDKEGEVIATTHAADVTDGEIARVLKTMVGTIAQRPSSVSAVKVGGERAYDRVRAGEKFELGSRQITISQLDILAIRHLAATTEVDIEVTCSAGTFIRAIARDLGEALKVGGHLSALRRTRVAGFSEKDAVSFQDLKDQKFTPLKLADVARVTFSVRELTLEEVTELSFGRPLSENGATSITAAMSPDNRLIALLKDDGIHAKPIAVFAAAN
ncbi:tRNA pseudouridine55 synthase [Candidatus Planktophila versatilis]|jgi:tRNA pseudouridine55 synthase|uniref:tRNA pseudouridine synthase B n=1 Tax=Candidatus Planktophila versatilis TaxID=1884905 RepID=A0AAC9YWJ0_9ACTN|nr:tRNA pseudouridine(55) synthase TruB [Candidatus Planktophila versatilis]ASY17435.1 tRNA pseudouridine55 synthase [Candidatus Planktophila versatilis]ASY22770.1 tRNA pseudouridine55 synthase [Candidatus Planktophila versatilis]